MTRPSQRAPQAAPEACRALARQLMNQHGTPSMVMGVRARAPEAFEAF